MARLRNPFFWIYNLAATVIGACAGAVPVVIVDPKDFNPFGGGDWQKLAAVMVVSGLIALASFLKQHPLPELAVEDDEKPAGV